MSAGALPDLLWKTLGLSLSGDGGKLLNEPDFLCFSRGESGGRAMSRSIMLLLGGGRGMTGMIVGGIGETGRFFEGLRLRTFLVVWRKDDLLRRCLLSTGEPGTGLTTADGSRTSLGSNAAAADTLDSSDPALPREVVFVNMPPALRSIMVISSSSSLLVALPTGQL